MESDRGQRLSVFVEWCGAHVKGDEKGEAQVFLDRLFQAFGQAGSLDVGGTPEFRIRKSGEDQGGVSFADYMWKPVVLIEMKRRGADLSRHVQQALDYWVRAAPNRPRYVVLCNFDEFRVYDFEADINEPQDTVGLAELAERYDPLAFLFPTREKPRFRIDRERVTREAADLLAAVYRRVSARADVRPGAGQRFILQVLICLFAEDIGLLPRRFFGDLLEECTDPPKAFDLFDGLFRAMNAPAGPSGGRFRGVQFFNGGIFSESAAMELDPRGEIAILKRAAGYNWAHISPDIFGTIFQHSMEAGERHAYGAHYTSQADILKIVKPTIVQPFTEAIQRAGSLKELAAVRARLQSLRVLDPACGSGNFLYIAYREMRRLEAAVLTRENEISKRQVTGQTALGGVSPRQFFGMDVLPFAVELAKVTLSLAPKLASDELHTTEPALPLYNLDANIHCMDALIASRRDGGRVMPEAPYEGVERSEWPAADVVIGNPPFLGAKRLKPERGAEYVNAVRRVYPEVPGMADYCVYWIRRSHDHLERCGPEDPFRGRAGLVGTQNIRNNQSRVGGLDHVVKSGTIVEAVENQPWSGEANVHVSIVNWVKHEAAAGGRISGEVAGTLLIPAERRLWHKVDAPPPAERNGNGNGNGNGKRKVVRTEGKRGERRDKSYELVAREVEHINSALSSDAALGGAGALSCNTDPQRSFQGVKLGYKGYMVPLSKRRAWLREKPKARRVVRPLLIGRDLVTGDGRPTRAVIDFGSMGMLEASAHARAFRHLEQHVLPSVKATVARVRGTDSDMGAARADHLERWWQFWNVRRDLRQALAGLRRHIACSQVTKRPIFAFICASICPDATLQVFALDDDYSFGVLQASPHWEWFQANSSKLTERFRYTRRSVWDTFPWPQRPTKRQVRAVAKAGREVRRVRGAAIAKSDDGLRGLYRVLELPGRNPLREAHAALDAAVLEAYGFSPRKGLVGQLLELNLAVAARIEKGESVTGPGVPASYGDGADLVTEDCIRP